MTNTGEQILTHTIPLTALSKTDIPTAGGKGANLGEAAKAGFPVLPGFILTTEAYQTFVNDNALQQQIVDIASTVSTNDPQSSAEASVAITALFLTAEMSAVIQVDLLSAYAALATEGEAPVAVRSSATAEDLPQASFAGQQESFLNVRGDEALLESVKECWASLWTARALAYRERMGIDNSVVSMAVVVQAMVPAEVSGILFTANPTTGARDELLVNASFGLGEAIVSGQVTPDSYLLDRENFTIKETTLSNKEMMIVSGLEQRTTIQPVPEAWRSESTLSPKLLGELAALGVRIEDHFGGVPQDIEWAVANGRFWLLQSRPITNLPPVPLRDVRWDPPRPGTIWMRRQVVEHMPEPLSPLFDELYLEEGLDQSMESLTIFMSDISGIEIKVWEFLDPPFAATVNGYAFSIASFNFSPKMVPLALRLYITVLPKMIRHLMPRWENESLPSYLAIIEQWKNIDLANASDEQLLRGIRELAHEDAVYWFAAAVPLGLARTSDAALDRFLKSVSKGSRLTSGAFLRGYPSKTAEAQAQLEAIARKINDSDDLRERVFNSPASGLLTILAAYPDIMAALRQYFDTYGHQIYNLDFAAPTLADDPLPVLLSLKTAVAHPERDIGVRQTKLAQERDTLAASTAQSLNPILRPIFKLLLGWAQRYSPNREVALFYVGAAWPALRRLALELGERLTNAGSLDIPDDVFYLKSAELAAASAARTQGSGRPDLAKLAREQRILRQARLRLDPPVVVPPGGKMKFGPIDMAMFEPKPRSVGIGPTLDGFAVSPGQVTAPASVIRSPEDFAKMVPDTILVCTTTTPAWTPLFAQAKGLVTDIGGALAHGSIVAREYGIPAVMGTGAATQRIKSGQLIRVDGDSGTVTLVDEVGESEDEQSPVRSKTGSNVRKKALVALVVGLIAGFVWWKRRR